MCKRIQRQAAILVGAITMLAGWAYPAAAQSDKAPEFPTDPRAWINSTPLTREMLQGKGAVLWYFEEDCPRCRERWPEMLAAARKYQGKPVVFIGVNSGSAPTDVVRYVRENRIDWPVIIDPARQFEQQSGVTEISLQNIYQMRVIGADGDLRTVSSYDIPTVADDLLRTARWKVDPTDLPEGLRSAWQAVEFGDYAKGAATIKKSLVARDDATRQAAEKLKAAVDNEWGKLAEAAKTALAAGNRWQAFKLYTQITSNFKGYELPPEIESQRRELEQSADVKREFDARRRYEAATKVAPSSASSRTRLINNLKLLIKDYEGTEAAQQADQLLTQMNAAS